MPLKKQETRGGKRPFSGRKKSPYKTKTIAFRVRLEWIEQVKEIVNKKINELKSN